jgi:hypothetical protein
LKTGGYGIRPYETTGILLTLLSFHPKKNGPKKRNALRRRSLPSANTGRAPSGMGPAMFAPSQWGIKNLFQKGFCGAFSLTNCQVKCNKNSRKYSGENSNLGIYGGENSKGIQNFSVENPRVKKYRILLGRIREEVH